MAHGAKFQFPDTRLALEATELVREASPPPLLNHCLRTYVFAEALGRRLKKSFDAELLYLGCVMHDLGLTERFIKQARFELDGADAAQDFLSQRGYPPERIAVVWEAIALHASMEIPLRRQAEVALLHMGVFTDGGMLSVDGFPLAFFEEVFEALPRMDSGNTFATMLAGVLSRKPKTAYLALQVDIARQLVPGFDPPNFCDRLRAAPYPFNT
jgi:hypothetical protein